MRAGSTPKGDNASAFTTPVTTLGFTANTDGLKTTNDTNLLVDDTSSGGTCQAPYSRPSVTAVTTRPPTIYDYYE